MKEPYEPPTITETPNKDFQVIVGESKQEDPEYMTLKSGQELFDKMWEEGDTITPNGYLNE